MCPINIRWDVLRAEPNAAVATSWFGLFLLIPAQQMLPDLERTVLPSVGISAGSFSLHAASAVAIDEEISSTKVTDAMASLVVKSMVSRI